MATTYDYNTGKPLAPGQAQSTYNTQTGQKIGTPTGSTSVTQGQSFVDTGGRTGIAQYNPNTGQALSAGQTVAVTSQNIAPANQVVLPNQNFGNNVTGTTNGINAGLANGTDGLAYKNGQFTYTAPKVDSNGTSEGSIQDIINNMVKNQNDFVGAPTSSEALYNSLPEKAAFEQAQQNVQTYTSQLNAITAQRDAEMLGLEGQGRGITESIIGGQQAKISREAAIQALPIQALLASAQGNLELAQSHLDTVFKLRSEDAKNQYDYRKDLFASIQGVVDKAEARQLALLDKKNDQNFTRLNDSINFVQDLSAEATKNNDVQAATQFAKIQQPDPTSPTFAADLQKYNSEVARIQGTMKPDALRAANIANIWQNIAESRLKTDPSASGLKSLSAEDNAKLNATPQAKTINDGARYAAALQEYKTAITDWGTGETLNPTGRGQLNSAYQSLVGTIKDYYQLGTLDNGVEKLVGLGIPKPTTLFGSVPFVGGSTFGSPTARIQALDTQLDGVVSSLKRSADQLGTTVFADSQEGRKILEVSNVIVEARELAKRNNQDFLNSLPTSNSSTPAVDNKTFFNQF